MTLDKRAPSPVANDGGISSPAIVFRVGHLVEGRDTAEIVRILAVCRELGFIPLAEYRARPYTVPHDQRTRPGWANTADAPPDGVASPDPPNSTQR